ncbi:MAG TPA: DNA translocase FtsK [Candidatus Paceibacterota bacterium]
MNPDELKLKVEELTETIKTLSDRQNSQYTDIMLELKEISEHVGSRLKVNGGAWEEIYDEAKDTVIRAGKASTSFLQRKMRIGYAKAAELMDKLEIEKVIGPGEGATPRKVLIKSEDHFPNFNPEDEDDLYAKAKQATIELGSVSVDMLQRKFAIGYARSARLIDILEDDNVVEDGDMEEPRKVLVKE